MDKNLVTHNLCITRVTCERNTGAGMFPREVFVAFHRHIDLPQPVCIVTVFISMGVRYVEWVEVPEPHRRQGLASEALEAIEAQIGTLFMDGVTEAGEGLVRHHTGNLSRAAQ